MIVGRAHAEEPLSARPLGDDLKAAFGRSIVVCPSDGPCDVSVRSVTCNGTECRATDRWHKRSVVAHGAAATTLRAHLMALGVANVSKIDCTAMGACQIVVQDGDEDLLARLRAQQFGNMKLGGNELTGSVVVRCDARTCRAACAPGTLFPRSGDCEGAPSDFPRDRAFGGRARAPRRWGRGDDLVLRARCRSDHPVSVTECSVTNRWCCPRHTRGRRSPRPVRAGTSATARANT